MPHAQTLRPLTSARGIAAWFVVLYHVRLSAKPLLGPDLVALFGRGYLAVDFFFMLSGFVIWLNYADRLRTGGWTAAPDFLRRRIARIYPLHLLMLAAALVFVIAHGIAGKPLPDHYPLAELPYHLLLIQNWGFIDHLAWNDPAWSISCEFAAYLLFPLLALSIDPRRWPTLALLGAIALLLLLLHTVMAAADIERLGTDISRYGLLRCLTQFGVGALLCVLWQRWRARAALASRLSFGLAALAFTVFLAGGPETLLMPLAFAGLLLGLALTGASSRNPLAARPIHYLGEISYATYMVHFLLFVAFKLVFVEDAHDISLGQLSGFLALTLFASILLHHLIEKPAQRWLNRKASQPAGTKRARPSFTG